MKLYPYRWDLEGGQTIKKVKQFYKDLFSSSCEDYWSDEGNNKRMQNYHKLSITLKYIKYFVNIDEKYVPCNSLLREFIGGSVFEDLK